MSTLLSRLHRQLLWIHHFQERQLKFEEYRDLAGSLSTWTRNSTTLMLDMNFPATPIELKVRTRRLISVWRCSLTSIGNHVMEIRWFPWAQQSLAVFLKMIAEFSQFLNFYAILHYWELTLKRLRKVVHFVGPILYYNSQKWYHMV